MMDPKPRHNRAHHIEVLRRLGPAQRSAQAMKLSDFAVESFRRGLRRRFPDMPDADFHALFLQRMALCHNRNY